MKKNVLEVFLFEEVLPSTTNGGKDGERITPRPPSSPGVLDPAQQDVENHSLYFEGEG